MIFSKKFVSDYVDISDKDIKTIAEDMTRIGNEYDTAEELVSSTNLVVGEVVWCDMHPSSDHLHVLKVNVGDEILNIVCGAPNVREGIKVIVAKSGAVLPSGVIEKSVIRGVESNGMCCSLLEIGIDKKYLSDEDINGICELPKNAPIGEDAIKYLELDDEVINFELTSNRSDLLSVIGLAYEVGAIYDRKVSEPTSEYNKVKDDFKNKITLSVETKNSSLFLLGRANNVIIKESPAFIKNRLIACGIRPINNVVDISNYVMLETGQPLHFYDADLVGNKLGVRMAKDGECLTTLDSVKRTLCSEDIVIYNESGVIGLAGVMGGLDTEINSNTKNILIEAAQFNGACIRKTAKRILRSEASSRFEKGIDVKRTYLAMERSKELLEKYALAHISKYTHEYVNAFSDDKIINISLDKINSVLGMNISSSEVLDVFKRLGFKCEVNNNIFTVCVPSRRLDISIKEDLIEEVGRIYGVDRCGAKLPVVPSTPGHIDKYVRDIKSRLSSIGLNEVITYSLISDEDYKKFTKEVKPSIKVLEPMVSERDTLRNSLVTSLMGVYEYNKARNNKDISIFEVGSGYYKDGLEYKEEEKLAILMTGNYISGVNLNEKVDFYYLKGIVENILEYLGFEEIDYNVLNDRNELHPGRSAEIIVNGECVGFLGAIHPNIYKEDVYVCEINLNVLKNISVDNIKYKEVSKYPSIKKDVSFILDNKIMSKDIINDIKKCGNQILSSVSVYDEYKMDNEKSLTFTLTFMDENRTLTEEEVMEVFNKVIDSVTSKYKAKLKNM